MIDEAACIRCGLCAAVCPGLGHQYAPKETAVETITGDVLACYNAWSRDEKLRHISASGGVVTTLVSRLLSEKRYDVAFSLDTYDYREQLRTKAFTAETFEDDWEKNTTAKSRYLPVSHENAVTFVKENPNASAIFIGTPCALRGLMAVLEKLHRSRNQYLMIGLFCDKIFNYNCLEYFQEQYAEGKELRALHFKNKESGGWPGDMKFFPVEGDPFYVPLSARAGSKLYFMPERCMYCVDKLNVQADISVGDNYTGIQESKLGSNSVMIRTKQGDEAWRVVSDRLEFVPIQKEDVQRAQALDMRLDNLYFGDLKQKESEECSDLNRGIQREKSTPEFAAARKGLLQKLYAGAVYDSDKAALKKQIAKDNKKPNPLARFVKRGLRFVKRKIIKR